jgi:hypothetical protein
MQKWGFGMAPLTPETDRKYVCAVTSVKHLLNSDFNGERSGGLDLDAISETKGLFSRCVRQDQWDWFTVWKRLGCPRSGVASRSAYGLWSLRAAIKESDEGKILSSQRLLHDVGTSAHLDLFLENSVTTKPIDGGYIYVLSTRELKDVLKIGVTTRSVEERVKEINRATGVMTPFGVRYLWNVRDPVGAERRVHTLLKSYRVRNDREFFKMEFNQAKQLINDFVTLAGIEVS